MKKPKRKRVVRTWSKETIGCETFVCAFLIATEVFHNSELGQKLHAMIKTGDRVRVTVERIERKKP